MNPLKQWRWLFLAVFATGFVFATWRPLLAPWVNDEPRLIGNALLYNAAGTWAAFGLRGTFGAEYGPLPTWLYQVLLKMTHDVATIVFTHAALFYVATVAGLLWLGREMQCRPGFAVVVAVSPAVCFYSRLMWDNALLIPISFLLLAGYTRYLRKPSALLAALLAAAALAACTIHAMAIPIAAALPLHLVLRRVRVPWPHLAAAAGGLAVTVAVFAGYIQSQWQRLAERQTMTARDDVSPQFPVETAATQDPRLTLAGGLAFAFSGTRQLTGDATPLPRYADGLPGGIQTLATGVSWMVHLAFAVGVLLTLPRLARPPRRVETAAPVSNEGVAAEARVAALLVVICMAVLLLATRPIAGPHYFNGTFAAYVALAWVGFERLPGVCRPIGLSAVAGALGVATLLCLANLVQTEGRPRGYGPTIGVQLSALRQAAGGGRIATDVPVWQSFPHAAQVLARLDGLQFAADPATPPVVVLGEQNNTGRLHVVNTLPPDRVEYVSVIDLRAAPERLP